MSQSLLSNETRRAAATVLIVDDSRTNLNVMGARLGQAGYLVVLSDNGREALDLIAGRGRLAQFGGELKDAQMQALAETLR